METTVFFLEDGAAILVLANSEGSLDTVDIISMWLTIICGLFYIFYFVILVSVSSIFQAYILITQVFISKDSFSGGLEIGAFVVYGYYCGCL